MGTRAIIRVVQDDKVYVTIYRQFDGYPDGAGREILTAIGRRKIVNGMSGQQASSIANGAGCLAALLVAGLKKQPGNIYLEPGASDDGVDYVYTVRCPDFAAVNEARNTTVYPAVFAGLPFTIECRSSYGEAQAEFDAVAEQWRLDAAPEVSP